MPPSVEPTPTSRPADCLPDSAGHFGPYGGRYVPETLVTALDAHHDAGAERSERVVLGAAAGVVVTSEWTRRQVLARYAIPARLVHVALLHLAARDGKIDALQHRDRLPSRYQRRVGVVQLGDLDGRRHSAFQVFPSPMRSMGG